MTYIIKRSFSTDTKQLEAFVKQVIKNFAGPSGRAVQGVVLRPLACWDCWREFHRDVCSECCV